MILVDDNVKETTKSLLVMDCIALPPLPKNGPGSQPGDIIKSVTADEHPSLACSVVRNAFSRLYLVCQLWPFLDY